MGRPIKARAVYAVAAVAAVGAVAAAGTASAQREERGARAVIRGVDGKAIGRLTLRPQRGGALSVSVVVRGLSPGFHGFHIHAIAACDPAARNPAGALAPFTTAGPHWNPGNVPHGDHPGDFPTLLANRAGQARATFTTDRFRIPELLDMDGSAVIVHANRDNQANIPSRYQSGSPPAAGPDGETLATGDSGARVGCGAIRLTRRAKQR